MKFCGVFALNELISIEKRIKSSAYVWQCKDRKEKGTVSLMRRLTSIKRSKSPPPSSYSMDNPVFEDSVSVATAHPVHVRYIK